MNAAETIQAAIDKLTRLRDDTTLAPWSVDTIPETGGSRVCRFFEFFGDQIEVVAPGGLMEHDAQLIVTLHATIEAQIAALETGLRFANVTPNMCTTVALDLSRAILGEQVGA